LPFQEKEMDDIIKDMPADRAPGPDGFNGMFKKHAGQFSRKSFISWLLIFRRGK
jgi:hypothetical protein